MPDVPLSSTPMIYLVVAVVSALALGLLGVVKATRDGLALLRGQIREDYQTDGFRDAVAKAMDSHSVTGPIEKIVERSVERATSSSFGALTRSIGDIATEQRTQATRISIVETKVEGVLARSQAQRRSDLPGGAT